MASDCFRLSIMHRDVLVKIWCLCSNEAPNPHDGNGSNAKFNAPQTIKTHTGTKAACSIVPSRGGWVGQRVCGLKSETEMLQNDPPKGKMLNSHQMKSRGSAESLQLSLCPLDHLLWRLEPAAPANCSIATVWRHDKMSRTQRCWQNFRVIPSDTSGLFPLNFKDLWSRGWAVV